eukprot:1159971-Pelagomonas_calceolata.AAC.1
MAALHLSQGFNFLKPRVQVMKDASVIMAALHLSQGFCTYTYWNPVPYPTEKDVRRMSCCGGHESVRSGCGAPQPLGYCSGVSNKPPRLKLLNVGVIVAALQSQGFSPPLKGLTRAVEGVEDDDSVRRKEVPYSYAP